MGFNKSESKANTKKEPTYEVIENHGIVGKRSGDWQIELRYMSWNGNEPKYDLRPWADTDEGEKCGKGITLSGEEMETLYEILTKIATE
jgi:hypothetical protein